MATSRRSRRSRKIPPSPPPSPPPPPDNDLSTYDDYTDSDYYYSESDSTYMPSEKDPNETEVSSEEEEEEEEDEDFEIIDDEGEADEEYEEDEAEDEEDEADDEADDERKETYEEYDISELTPIIKNAILQITGKKPNEGNHIHFDEKGRPFFLIVQTDTQMNKDIHDDCKDCKDTASATTNDKTGPPVKRSRDDINLNVFTAKFTKEENEYWKQMSPPEKDDLFIKYKDMRLKNTSQDLPLRFKLLHADLDASSKSLILAKLDQFQKMPEHSGEYFKLRNWLNGISRLPLGVYKPLPIKDTFTDKHTDAVNFLKEVKTTLDRTVFGQNEVKNQLMRIMAQWISNPDSKGNCIGLQGAMGVGKTSLIKQGLCTALGLPFGFISLGGASDASFLEGHGFTYEGSTYGKVAEILMKTKCMNPVLFFDELDKVSHTYRGEEIIGILTHLTDSSQNERFNDRYFGEIDLNLSKALIIFSYNDETKINPILKDRMITIHVDGYDMNDKVNIAKDYLIPELLKEYKRTSEDILFSTEVIEKIIEKVPKEEGVRNLKRGIESIISWLNMHTYLPVIEEDSKGRPGKTLKIKLGDTTTTNAKLYTYPVTVTEEHIEKYIKDDPEEAARAMVTHSMYL